MWRNNHSINELEFLAENVTIEIIPNFKKDEINLLCVGYINIGKIWSIQAK